ncbi:MAG TPA: ATP-binding protein [Thermoanaerobaculia bacterium]|nr:ATP-binding protein [Thermoanaerobaculia bacterium]
MLLDKLTSLARLTDSLSRAMSVEEVYAVSLDCLQESLGVERASILLFDANEVMSFVAWRGISDQYRSAVNGHTPWRPETENPEPVLVSDAELDPALTSYLPVFRAEGIRALGFFALTHRDRVIGKFMVYYATAHDFNAEEVALAKTIAGQIAFGVTRIVAEQALEAERERLGATVANVPGMVWETVGSFPEQQKVTFVSEGMRELTGYEPEEWYRDPRFWSRIIVERIDGDMRSISESSIHSAVPAVHHYKLRRRDGRIIWVEVRSAHRMINGTLVSRGVTMDITERKRAERRNTFLAEASGVLSASLDYERTLSQIADLIVAGFGDRCVIDVGEQGTISRIAVAHRDDSSRSMAEHVPDELELVRRVIETGSPILMRELDGDLPHSERTCQSLMVVPLTAAGRTLGAISIFSADPVRRYDENDLALAVELGRRGGYAIDHARLYREAQAANRSKDEFLATLSHELRTPMTAALGWASMLRFTDTPPETFHLAVETIERSIRAQAKLIDDIFDVSRIVTGKLQLQVAAVDLQRVIQAAVETIQPSISAKSLRLELVYDAINETLLGDAARLQQVIWNLLSNAVKFTPAGGTIRIAVTSSQGEVQVSVGDSGQGIPEHLLPVVFERFRQGDSSATRAHGGLGLGLAIVKSIVELHGGSVIAESAGEGQGAVFTVVLPGSRPRDDSGLAASRPDTSAVSLAGVNVLVVEDDDDTRMMLTRALEQHGASVIAVSSAPTALDALRRQPPHVVISDIAMPGEDGCSLMMKIREGAVESCRDVPAIAITAFVRPEDRERILAAGFHHHLEKPVDAMDMLHAVRNIVGTGGVQSEVVR